MPWRGPEWEGEFPSLGWQVAEWIEEHCVVPDREDRGKPFRLTDEQLSIIVNHYRLRPDASQHQWQTAWEYVRSLIVKPQKWGKAPLTSALVSAEAVAPVVFAGWDAYGEPVGRPWPTPVIQVTAYSEDQTDNIWKVLRPMIDEGPLANLIPDTGVDRINLPGSGWIEPVTSKALSRLGARITFAPQDEVGTWTTPNMKYLANTQYRGLSGTGGRSFLTTNAWDLAENSVAQEIEELGDPTDYVNFRSGALAGLSYTNAKDRARIHRHVYGDSAIKLRDGIRVSGWVSLDRIEVDAVKLLRKDPTEAARFYGNISGAGSGSWLPQAGMDEIDPNEKHLWADKLLVRDRPKSGPVCGGFDGSDVDDWTGIRLETQDQFQFTPTYFGDQRRTIWNPAVWPGHRVPRDEVMTAWHEIMRRFEVVRVYFDTPLWGTELQELQGKYGDKVFIGWETYRTKQMHFELERFRTDITNPVATFRQDGCQFTEQHMRNAVMRARQNQTYILGKPSGQQKIDLAMSSTLAHAATLDAIAAGDFARSARTSTTFYGFS